MVIKRDCRWIGDDKVVIKSKHSDRLIARGLRGNHKSENLVLVSGCQFKTLNDSKIVLSGSKFGMIFPVT